jgi:prepilin-type N-terminal cleavage/methylation domain-containing protein
VNPLSNECGPTLSLRPTGRALRNSQGFTLLEVLVALTVLAVGASITISLLSGSLGNIRKVQARTRIIDHAQTVMELALLDEAIQGPTGFSGDFEDGTRWSVRVEEYENPDSTEFKSLELPQNIRAKLLHYTVEMFSPASRVSDYHLQTLKWVKGGGQNQPAGPTQ